MIEFTIKTLDGRNHPFSVEDRITVQQLKQKVSESIGIAPDVQRLIFCGRVMMDDVWLSEYNVHGKVVHLVQRAPPSVRGTSTVTSDRPQEGNPGLEGNYNHHFRRFMLPVTQNADTEIFLEGLAMPRMVIEDAPNLSPTAARLELVRRMITEIRNDLQSLEMNAANAAQDPGALGQLNASVVVASTSDSMAIAPEPPVSAPSTAPRAHSSASSAPESMETDAHAENLENERSAEARSSGTVWAAGGDQHTNLAGTSGRVFGESRRPPQGGLRPRFDRPRDLAAMMEELVQLQQRLAPFNRFYIETLRPGERGPPTLNPDQTARSQFVVDTVSSINHSLSHAFHAISDIRFNVSFRYRQLDSDPVAAPQINPIQAQINITSNRRPPAGANQARRGGGQGPTATVTSNTARGHIHGLENLTFGPMGTAAVEVIMELGQQGLGRPPGMSETQPPPNTNQSHAHFLAGPFLWGGGPPTNDFMQNLMTMMLQQGILPDMTAMSGAQGQAAGAQGQTAGAQGQTAGGAQGAGAEAQRQTPGAQGQPAGAQSQTSQAPGQADDAQAQATRAQESATGAPGQPTEAQCPASEAQAPASGVQGQTARAPGLTVGHQNIFFGVQIDPLVAQAQDAIVQGLNAATQSLGAGTQNQGAGTQSLNAGTQGLAAMAQGLAAGAQGLAAGAQGLVAVAQVARANSGQGTTPGLYGVAPGVGSVPANAQAPATGVRAAAPTAQVPGAGTQGLQTNVQGLAAIVQGLAAGAQGLALAAQYHAAAAPGVNSSAQGQAPRAESTDPGAQTQGTTERPIPPIRIPDPIHGLAHMVVRGLMSQGQTTDTSNQPPGNTQNRPTTGSQPNPSEAPVNNAGNAGGMNVRRGGSTRSLSLTATPYDRFLPCESTHIRRQRRLRRTVEQAHAQQQSADPGPVRRCRYHRMNNTPNIALPVSAVSSLLANPTMTLESSDIPPPPAESQMNNLLTIMDRIYTILEVVNAVNGRPDALDAMQAQLRAFVNRFVLRGVPPHRAHLLYEIAAETLVDFHMPFLSNPSVRGILLSDVDLVQSVRSLVRQRLPEVLDVIIDERPHAESFSTRFTAVLTRSIEDLGQLLEYCCNEGAQGMRTFLANYLENTMTRIEPQMQRIMMAVSLVVNMYNRPIARYPNSIREHVVYYESPELSPMGNLSPIHMSEEDYSSIPSELPSTPHTPDSQLSIDFPDVDFDLNVSPTRFFTIPPASEDSPTQMMNTGGVLPSSGLEAVGGDVPAACDPVMKEDAEEQELQVPQPPFSNAYMSGMQSMRRKMIETHRPPVTLQGFIQESLREATTASTSTATVDITEDIDDLSMTEAFRDHIRELMLMTTVHSSDEYDTTRYPALNRFRNPPSVLTPSSPENNRQDSPSEDPPTE